MEKYIILLPLTYNDGTSVPSKVLRDVISELYVLANGYTIEGQVKGAYRMQSGKKQEDVLLKVWVLISPGDADALRQLVRRFCIKLRQESIWLERSASFVEFVAGDLPVGE